jgi:hypothetical protein
VSVAGRIRRSTISEMDETKVDKVFYLSDAKDAAASEKTDHIHRNSSASFSKSSQRFHTQLSAGLEHSIHPMVYLHNYAMKPPVSEYTSITDCIDTSAIDRPPSPPAGNHNVTNSSAFAFSHLINPTSNRKISDYCSADTPRRAIARQESEMLKLAEESQHVIIHQMFNKMQKATSASLKKNEMASTVKIVNEPKGDSDEEIKTLNDDTEMSYDISESDTLQPMREHQAPMGLSHRNRNSSQIWFAQSAAETLCLDLNEDENIIV